MDSSSTNPASGTDAVTTHPTATIITAAAVAEAHTIHNPPHVPNQPLHHENTIEGTTNTTNTNTSTNMSDKGKIIKARQSFSLREKISYVMAFQQDCHPSLNITEKESLSLPLPLPNAHTNMDLTENEHANVDTGEDNINDMGNISKPKKKLHKHKAKMKSMVRSSNGLKTKKLKAWLKAKNRKDDTSIAYTTMYKWVKKYAKMDLETEAVPSPSHRHQHRINHCRSSSSLLKEDWESSVSHLKKIRSRPFEELELVLVAFLKVRNETLRRKGLAVSNIAFIKDRANLFYRDMYGEEETDFVAGNESGNINCNAVKPFKCSAGWAQRFKERYKDILEPERVGTNIDANHPIIMVQHQLQPQNITMENVPAVTHEGTFENIRAHAMQVLPRPSTDPYVLRPSTDPFVAQKFKSIKDADSSVTL